MKKLHILIEKYNNLFWTRVVLSTKSSTESLAIFRIVAGIFILSFGFPYFLWIGDVPQIFYDPPFLSVNNLLPGFPSSSYLLASNISLLGLLLMIIVGIKARLSSLLFFIILFVNAGFHFSLGKIDHGFTFYLILFFCMSFSDWGSRLALVPDKPMGRNEKAMSLLAILICFGFFTAAFEKSITWSNLDFSVNGSGAWYYKSFETRSYLLAPYVPRYLPFWGFKIMDYLAIVFEYLPLVFLLRSRKSWHIWLVTAVIFHLCNVLIFNINFINVCIIYLAFINYERLFIIITRLKKSKYLITCSFFLLTTITVGRLTGLLTKTHSANILIPKKMVEENFYFAVLLALVIISVFLWDLLNISRTKNGEARI